MSRSRSPVLLQVAVVQEELYRLPHRQEEAQAEKEVEEAHRPVAGEKIVRHHRPCHVSLA